jgi:hypothetical protein
VADRPWIRRALALALGLGFTLLLAGGLELALRTLFPQKLRGFPIEGQRFNYRDRAGAMRLVPLARWRFVHPEFDVEYAVNRHGLRDEKHHYGPVSSTDRVRVLVVGDSFTFGQGVDYDQTWPVLAESRLQEQEAPIELIKAGIPGHDTRTELRLMRELLPRYDYDAVVVGFLINDLYSNLLEEERRRPGSGRPQPPTWIGNLFHGREAPHLLTLVSRLAISNREVYCRLYERAPERGEFFSVPAGPRSREAWRIARSLLRQMAAFARGENLRLVVYSLPQQAQVLCEGSGDIARFDRLLQELGRQEGFAVVAALDDFRQARRDAHGGSLFYPLDGHFTARGQRLAAEVFLREVVPLLTRRPRREPSLGQVARTLGARPPRPPAGGG